MLLPLLPAQVNKYICSSFLIVTSSEMQAKFGLLLQVLLLVRRAAFLSLTYSRHGLQNPLSSQGVSCPLGRVKPYHRWHWIEILELWLCKTGIMAVWSALKCVVGKCIYETGVRTILLFALLYVGIVKKGSEVKTEQWQLQSNKRWYFKVLSQLYSSFLWQSTVSASLMNFPSGYIL